MDVRKPWDAVEEKDALHLRVDMPSLGKDDVRVYVEENSLVIKGEAQSDAELDDSGRKYNSRIDLPPKVYKLDQIKAQMKNGALKVSVPKYKEEEMKSIINVNETYDVFQRGMAVDVFIKHDGQPFMGQVWPGAVVGSIFKLYTESTDGSFVEEKESAVVWHFQDADPDFGSWQAKELLDHLKSVLANEPVVVKSGQQIVEVKPQGVSKGVAVEKLLTSMVSQGSPPDFILCIGDDHSDEDMFEIIDSAMASFPKP